ncbi:hypothetical protein [Actinoplanes sp. L3-i22]|uniref:hypothetical protein n=1 Tax=Actinoplanes sp. L3-i22 TaxID=2836373 RepID=UPI001C762576|nr:hypothetical protein [Actinoplanes sp. L3-i22]BCY12476.1 hypothetical protein L3i22_075640 [Actinoplanes sp. L3-i22]
MRILVRAGLVLLIALHLLVTIGGLLVFAAGGDRASLLTWTPLVLNLAAWGLLAFRRTRGTWAAFAGHALAVLPMIWIFAVADSGPDANIGKGLIGLYLLAWGLPGSLLGLAWNATTWFSALAVVTPVLNLALHAGWLIRRRRHVGLQPVAA